MIFASLSTLAGCSSDDTLAGRVAIDVKVVLGNASAGNGTLVLRPMPGVKCPLIRIPVHDGEGHLSASEGPVPGDYKATFRSDLVASNITDHLSETGRVDPEAVGGTRSMNETSDGQRIPVPKGDVQITVADADPADVIVTFEVK